MYYLYLGVVCPIGFLMMLEDYPLYRSHNRVKVFCKVFVKLNPCFEQTKLDRNDV